MRYKNKITSIVASLLACAVFVSCGGNKEDSSKEEIKENISLSDVNISTLNSTYKILQSDSFSGDDKIQLNVVKGEYESYQLILSAEKDVKSYNVETFDLSDGTNTLSKDNIAVFKEKYIEVKENFEGTSAPTGMYPDALIPIEKAVEYKENNIKQGESQAILVRFYIPVDQQPGTYKGKLNVKVENLSKEISIFLNVHDITVNQKTTLRSKFNIFDQYYLGELDSTQKMLDTYINFLGEYRLSPGTAVQGGDVSPEETARKAYEIMQNDKLSSFAIGCPTKKENGLLTLNNEVLADAIKLIVDECIKNYNVDEQKGFNLLAKLMMTASIIDEPDQTGRMHLVPGVLKNFHKAIKSVMDYIDNSRKDWAGVDDQFIDEIRQNVKDFNLVLSMSYNASVDKINSEIANNDCGQVIFCPYISDYGLEEDRAKYTTKDKWAYICNNPKPPFSTYHIEDNLLSSRVLGWEMSEYNIDGLFYWAADLNGKFDKGSGYQPMEDKFQTADRYPKCNGDGFLMYPGASYGIYGPVPSVRLESIRDGIEEYELWNSLKEVYKLNGCDIKDIQRAISSLLYSEAKVYSGNNRMALAREYLFEIISLTNDENLFIKKIEEKESEVNYYIQVKDNCVLSGENVEKIDGNNYKVKVYVNGVNNNLKFTAKNGDKNISVDMNLKGTTDVLSKDEINSICFEKDGKLKKEIIEKSTINSAYKTEKAVKLTIGSVKKKDQSVKISGDVISALNDKVRNFSFVLYNPTNEIIPLSIYAQYENGTILNILKCDLNPGENKVDFYQCASTDWKKYGKYKALNCYFTEEKGDYAERVLYLMDMRINKF